MNRLLTAGVILFLFAGLVAYAVPPGTNEEIAERLEPFGSVCRSDECGSASAVAATGPLSGEQVYNQFCFACHASGVSDAPRFGNADDWEPRLAKSVTDLVGSTVNGLGAMPPMGTCMSCSEDEISQAVDYMLEQLP